VSSGKLKLSASHGLWNFLRLSYHMYVPGHAALKVLSIKCQCLNEVQILALKNV